MGVPAFYRWLSEKYGQIVVDCIEERATVVDGHVIPLDLTSPNPNGVEFDNLYIDMNGIIHPCAHPEDAPQPSSEEEMYVNIFKYVDRLVAAVRPRRVLYMAVDGVAPRAKMNQQRSRRFRTAQDDKHRQELYEKAVEELKAMGRTDIPPEKDSWDSNVITPGTEFMWKLSKYLQYYVYYKQNTDKAWAQIKVIISDASVPGEGEHKLMAYIRQQRAQPGYDPNQRHVLHGLDADLIMLGLATHEPNFSILREQVFFGRQGNATAKGAENGENAAPEVPTPKIGEYGDSDGDFVFRKPLQFLHISILREYLKWEFKVLETMVPFGYDFERVVDDFVFMCFFVGNDFLPHLPALDIRDGAIDFLFAVYKRILPSLGDYLTNAGVVNLSKADVLLAEVGKVEDEVFKRKREKEERSKWRREQRKAFDRNRRRPDFEKNAARQVVGSAVALEPDKTPQMMKRRAPPSESENAAAAKKLRAQLMGEEDVPGPIEVVVTKVATDEEGDSQSQSEDPMSTPSKGAEGGDSEVNSVASVPDSPLVPDSPIGGNLFPYESDKDEAENSVKLMLKRKLKELEEKELDQYRENVKDNVRLGEHGWKDRYYSDKLKMEDFEKGGGKERLCKAYVEGLCWVMLYYYKGCPSWNWFYPFHYAPFASDLVNIDRFDIKFEQSQPFRPFDQLMAVLPGRSAHALPKPCRWLMNDEESPIIDFYPTEVPLDPNGKAMPWLFVVLLPFIEEQRLLDAIKPVEQHFTPVEHERNRRHGDELLFLHDSNAVMEFIPEEFNEIELDAHKTKGFSGTVKKWSKAIAVGAIVPAPELPRDALQTVRDNLVHAFCYQMPPPGEHICRFLPGTVEPPPILQPHHLVPRVPRLSRESANMVELATPADRMIRHSLGVSNSYFGGQHDLGSAAYNRNWGTNEPRPKHIRFGEGDGQLPTPPMNPFMQGRGYGRGAPQYQNQSYHRSASPPIRPPLSQHHLGAFRHQQESYDGYQDRGRGSAVPSSRFSYSSDSRQYGSQTYDSRPYDSRRGQERGPSSRSKVETSYGRSDPRSGSGQSYARGGQSSSSRTGQYSGDSRYGSGYDYRGTSQSTAQRSGAHAYPVQGAGDRGRTTSAYGAPTHPTQRQAAPYYPSPAPPPHSGYPMAPGVTRVPATVPPPASNPASLLESLQAGLRSMHSQRQAQQQPPPSRHTHRR